MALWYSLMRGSLGAARLLCEAGARIAERDRRTRTTLLHLQARYGRTDSMRFLLERGADVDAQDYEGYTPLMLAVLGGHIRAVRLLLTRKADTRLRDRKANTALDLAKQRALGERRTRLIKLLKDAGARE